MSFNYSGLEETALRQIENFGRPVMYRSITTGSFNTRTGSITGDAVSETTIKAVLLAFRDSQIDVEFIRRCDKQALVAGASFATPPKTNDIIDDGSDYKVVNVETVQPGDTVLIYKLQVRK